MQSQATRLKTGISFFAVFCLSGVTNALVDYDHAVEHIAKVITDHQDDFHHEHMATPAHKREMENLKVAACMHFEPNHHQVQECYTIFELDPCKTYLDDPADYNHC